MTTYTKIGLVSFATLALVGCGDSYSSNDDTPNNTNSLKSLNRTVKFLTDTNGMSLYTFDKDSLNKSNCDAECQKIWPLFEGANTTSEDIKVLEGTDHLAYRKHPLYHFVKDNAVGDVNGDNVKNVWHLVYAPIGSNDTQTEFSAITMTQTYLTDKNGMALYTFDKDSTNISRCTGKQDTKPLGSCEARWPVFYAKNLGTLPQGTNASDFGTIDRPSDTLKDADGKPLATKQTTYKGLPLYYWFKDQKSGDVTGDWVSGVWHAVELHPTTSTPNSTPNNNTPTGDVEAGKAIFTNPSKCSSCHGVDGKTKPLGVDNVIARYGDAKLIKQKLIDMRDNGNPNNRNGAMVAIARGLNDEQISNLSAFVATLKK